MNNARHDTGTTYKSQGRLRPELIALATWEVFGRFSVICGKLACYKGRARTLTGISLVAVEVELVRAGRRPDVLVGLDCIHPDGQPTAVLAIRPAPIGCQHPPQSKNPRSGLDVHKRDLRTHEKGPARVRYIKQLVESVPQLLRMGDLFLLLLLLKHAVEVRHNVPVNLRSCQRMA